jgi:hypothetical protein
MIIDLFVGSPPQEGLVRMNTVPSQQRPLWFWYKFFDILEQVGCCLLWRRFRGKNFRCQAALAMCLRAPLILIRRQSSLDDFDVARKTYHLIHPLLRLVDHSSPSFLVHNFQISIGNHAKYFNNNIFFNV